MKDKFEKKNTFEKACWIIILGKESAVDLCVWLHDLCFCDVYVTLVKWLSHLPILDLEKKSFFIVSNNDQSYQRWR